jgi:tetratricopeptide (TPR) repeat protein
MQTRLSYTVCGMLVIGCAFVADPVASLAHEGLHHDIERETRLLAANPDDVDAHLRRARYYRLHGEPQKALLDVQQATRLAPDDVRPHFERGLALADLGRDAEAEGELTAFLSQTGGTEPAYAERARIRARMGRPEAAIDDLAAAIRLRPSIDLYLERGRLLESRDRHAQAAACYRDGLTQLGESPLLRRALVAALIALERHEDALIAIDEAPARGGLESGWLLERADVLERLGRDEEAHAARRRALATANASLSRRPTSANLVARAEAHLALGDRAAARRDLEQALRSSPQMERARAMLSAIQPEPDTD